MANTVFRVFQTALRVRGGVAQKRRENRAQRRQRENLALFAGYRRIQRHHVIAIQPSCEAWYLVEKGAERDPALRKKARRLHASKLDTYIETLTRNGYVCQPSQAGWYCVGMVGR